MISSIDCNFVDTKIELFMEELKVTFYLKRNEERADGTMPVLGRIRIGKSMVQFSAKVYAIPSTWDVKSGRAVGKSKASVAVNKELDRMSVDIRSAYKSLLAKKENITAEEVKIPFKASHRSRKRSLHIVKSATRIFCVKLA